MALECPERVRGLILGGTGGGALAMAGLYFKSALNSRTSLIPWGEALIQGASSEPVAQYWKNYVAALQQDNLEYGDLESVNVTSLIIVGDGDCATDFAAFYVTQMLEERMPNAKRIIIYGTNHMTCSTDHRFLETVISFLGNLPN
jgi:pimeloyl-ACP methyl ester carboxylesterase